MNSKTSQRVLQELCKLIGFNQANALAEGAKLQIDDNIVTFVYDEQLAPQELVAYVDMGPAKSSEAHALEALMKLNFSLGAGSRGVLSLHPVTGHVFYSFRYALDKSASGQSLLDNLIRCVGDVGIDAQAVSELTSA